MGHSTGSVGRTSQRRGIIPATTAGLFATVGGIIVGEEIAQCKQECFGNEIKGTQFAGGE
jgi:hypothetical protein